MKWIDIAKCFFSDHKYTKITEDTFRGVVCGYTYFEKCDHCDKVIAHKGCQHKTCLSSIERFNNNKAEIIQP